MINRCPVLSAPTDWKETPDAHVFVTDVPGLTKDDVKVDIVDDEGAKVLQISGEKIKKDKEKDSDGDDDDDHDKWRRVERFRGKFLRRFRLPEDAKADEVSAALENGVLTVRIPKQEVKKPEKKVIQVEVN